jgi:hypothetical protein
MNLARHRLADDRAGEDPTGGAAGNERLTAMTGAVLLVLLAVEGFTLLGLHAMLTLHFFIGMLLVGPVILKIGSTSYRFARYYLGAGSYVRKGPPPLMLRLLGPLVMITSVGVIGTGVALALTGPPAYPWQTAHELFFVAWFAVMAVHVTWYAPQLPRLLRSGSPQLERTRTVLAGAGRRWLLLTAALAAGLIIAIATYHLAGRWAG